MTSALEFSEFSLNPFLHFEAERVLNPMNDVSIESTNLLHQIVVGVAGGSDIDAPAETQLEWLLENGFLIRRGEDISDQYYLKYAAIETHSVCNQSCYFCPVSISPKAATFMDDLLFDRVVDQLTLYQDTLEGVFLNGFNEPTLDKRLIQHMTKLTDAGFKIAINTNGSGLTPTLVQKMASLGSVEVLTINFHTLNPGRYAAERGVSHFEKVLSNIDHLATINAFPRQQVVVLGSESEQHEAELAVIRDRYRQSHVDVISHTLANRSGNTTLRENPTPIGSQTYGCDQTGSRVIQHIHIAPSGECLVCCQDYHEEHVIGDLRTQSIHDVMTGDEVRQWRKKLYGVVPSESDFFCRRCEFAITDHPSRVH